MSNFFKNIFALLNFNTKPYFLIIGAQKAGTTGLFYTLKKHPELSASNKKEIHYFDNDSWYKESNIRAYHKFFPLKFKENLKSFEATPSYIYHKEVPERLFNYNKNIKLILMVRNPTERALSAWTMYHHKLKEDPRVWLYDARSFSQAINEELENRQETNFSNDFRSYLNRGIYISQLKNYLKFYPMENILIIEDKELLREKEKTIKKICHFLGIKEVTLELKFGNKRLVDNHKLYEKTKSKLDEFYRGYNQEFYNLISRDFKW